MERSIVVFFRGEDVEGVWKIWLRLVLKGVLNFMKSFLYYNFLSKFRLVLLNICFVFMRNGFRNLYYGFRIFLDYCYWVILYYWFF